LLTPIGTGPVKLRTSLYSEDVVVLIRPIANDVANLHQLLLQFGQATCLNINIQNYEIFPIQCSAMDLPTILKIGQFHLQLSRHATETQSPNKT
jgi:hypothetical protein